jgi:hypothetical protein
MTAGTLTESPSGVTASKEVTVHENTASELVKQLFMSACTRSIRTITYDVLFYHHFQFIVELQGRVVRLGLACRMWTLIRVNVTCEDSKLACHLILVIFNKTLELDT